MKTKIDKLLEDMLVQEELFGYYKVTDNDTLLSIYDIVTHRLLSMGYTNEEIDLARTKRIATTFAELADLL